MDACIYSMHERDDNLQIIFTKAKDRDNRCTRHQGNFDEPFALGKHKPAYTLPRLQCLFSAANYKQRTLAGASRQAIHQ